MCRRPKCAGHAGWRRWWRAKSSYLPLPSLPGTAPGAQIPGGLQCWPRDCECATASGVPARSKHEDIPVRSNRQCRLQKGTFLPFGHEKASTSMNRNKELDLNTKQSKDLSFDPAWQILQPFTVNFISGVQNDYGKSDAEKTASYNEHICWYCLKRFLVLQYSIILSIIKNIYKARLNMLFQRDHNHSTS